MELITIFLTPTSLQQNGVVERKNRNFQEMARNMLNENNLPKYFRAEVVNTSCYVLNRVLLRPILKKTPYELWKNKKPNISDSCPIGVSADLCSAGAP